MRIFILVLFLMVPMTVRGATCPAGQYLENNVCKDCEWGGNYCPGDDTRHACPSADGTNFQQLLTECGLHDVPEFTVGEHAFSNDIYGCYAVNYEQNMSSREGRFIVESPYNAERSDYWNGCSYRNILFYAANDGYYLSGYIFTNGEKWYFQAKKCTNEHPANSHYSGPGTPDDPVAGGKTDYNDCPWACDDGYVLRNGECIPLCTAGATKFHVGDYVFNIYKDKLTTPAINIGLGDGTVCYVSLVPGVGKGALNVDYKGVIYHTSD